MSSHHKEIMTSFKRANKEEFDAAKRKFARDEHEFLESRFYDQHDRIVAKVMRYLDGEGELKAEADLMIPTDIPAPGSQKGNTREGK
jgi:hypothetical protein